MKAYGLLPDEHSERMAAEVSGEVHIRASWIFTRTDALANLGTILGGTLVLATRSALPDLIAGAAITLVVLYGSFEITRDAVSERSFWNWHQANLKFGDAKYRSNSANA